MAIDKITTPAIADDAVTSAKVSYNKNQFRNLVINGDMSIAQRGADINDVAHGGYCSDRFRFHKANTGELVMNFDQVTDVPSSQGFTNSLKLSVGTAESATASNELVGIGQRIEAQNLQYLKYGTSSAETLTISFWVKSSVTGTYAAFMFQQDASSSPDRRYYSKTFTIDSADTWEKKTIQITGNQDDTIANDNDIGLDFRIILSAGSGLTSGSSGAWGSDTNSAVGQTANFSGTSSATFFLTGVQIEAGTSASDFEFLPHDVNFRRCQRYYYVHATANQMVGTMWWYQSGINSTTCFFPTEMRSAPSLTTTTGTNYYRVFTGGSATDFNSLGSIQNASPHAAAVDSSLSGSSHNVGRLRCNTGGEVVFSSEL